MSSPQVKAKETLTRNRRPTLALALLVLALTYMALGMRKGAKRRHIVDRPGNTDSVYELELY